MKSTLPPALEALAIPVPAGQSAQYMFGDNLEGYLEGWTARDAAGDGYRLDGASTFRGFASGSGRTLRDHATASLARISPHGIRHDYPDGLADELLLLRRRRAITLRLHAPRPRKLLLAPLLDPGHATLACRGKGKTWTLTLSDRSRAISIHTSHPVRLHSITTRHGFTAPCFETEHPASSLTLHLAFASTPSAARSSANALAREAADLRHQDEILAFLERSSLTCDHTDYTRALAWAKLTSYFLVSEEFGKGIWAGLPWFKNNWGRDTFIALPGTLLVTGAFAEARQVIETFFTYQNRDPKSPDYGRVPNRVSSPTDIIYNTTDGTPWLIRETLEYLHYTGDLDFARSIYPSVKLALQGAIKRFVDKQQFLTHDHADTWMDARIEGNLPWSARGNRANDIQALWHNALLAGARLADLNRDPASARAWRKRADLLKQNFNRMFWNPRKNLLADRLRPDDSRDEKNRPNQLMVLSIPMEDPLLPPSRERAVVERAVQGLLYPYGIASLSQDDPYFHPYHHHDDLHHFDAAYHNGTVWGWNAGFTVTALCRHRHTELAWKLSRNLAHQILHLGCRGSMSELIEAIPRKKGRLTLSGTWAQAWSTSEFARNGFQDYLGCQPRLLDQRILLAPRIPKQWNKFSARVPFGRHGLLLVTFHRHRQRVALAIRFEGHDHPLDLAFDIEHLGHRYAFEHPLHPSDTLALVIEKGRAHIGLNGAWRDQPLPGQPLDPVTPLNFLKPSLAPNPPSLRKKHYLQTLIESGRYR
ncbi:MAG TPA: amylo-alpha-1,6-glucosidase [Kiritimatiellia bacterium]|nr:amylo-alpha-1,6-glucosidase [Kiritimatiellia bacterium]